MSTPEFISINYPGYVRLKPGTCDVEGCTNTHHRWIDITSCSPPGADGNSEGTCFMLCWEHFEMFKAQVIAAFERDNAG